VLTDDPTLRFYAENAVTYAAEASEGWSPRLDAFLDRLPQGAHILELGTGPGHDARHMLDRGFDLVATDGSPELAAQATRLIGQQVRVMLFEALDEVEAYQGIYANASLLHAPRAALSDILGRIHHALRPDGLFWASYKAGDAAGHDRFGRYYNYLDERALRRHYGEAAAWKSLDISTWNGSGYDRVPTKWLAVTARK
jgi:SAM-dependent methyltransferase